MQEVLDLELPDLEKEVEDICKNYMRGLYTKLQDEYEALTSKEAIWHTIVANDIHELQAA